jgi:ATP-dependent Clp protease ATP-binding subunit ClpA
MDGAKLTDNNGVVSDFKNVIVVMTSNIGTKEANVMGFEKNSSGKIDRALKDFFTPEFINRLSGLVEFNNLSLENILLIVDTEIEKLNILLKDKKIVVKVNKKAKEYIANEGYDDRYGARNIARVINSKIKEQLTDEILFGSLIKGGTVSVSFSKELIFKYKRA